MIDLGPILGMSLLEPWASLVAYNFKHFETRSWKSSYRGLIAIHEERERTKYEEAPRLARRERA